MILMAADYVGNKITEFLCKNGKGIDVFVYDSGDRGSYNASMIKCVKAAYPNAEVYENRAFMQPEILDHVQGLHISLGCLAWWPNIIDERIINMTERGFVNTHPGYLPYNRGKHPYFWSIVDGTKFGVTLHYVNADIDSGPIIAQREIPVCWTDTGESLYMRSREEILDLFYQYFDQIAANTVEGKEQAAETGTFHYGKELEPMCTLSLDKQYTARQLLNILRGRMFNGKGAVRFTEDGKEYVVSIKIEEKNTKD